MTENHKMAITAWDEQDRPREKLLAKGRKSLSDAELIAILIGSGSRTESAVDLAKRILSTNNNNINQLAKQSISDLVKFKGIGEAKAISIVAALELGGRRQQEEILKREKITSSEDVFKLFAPSLSDLPHEEFWVLYLNRANKIISSEKISHGGITGTVTDVRIVIRSALEKHACAIIAVHNHPSGNLTPSNEDKIVTKKLKEAGGFFDINLLDHIIIAQKEYYSFSESSEI